MAQETVDSGIGDRRRRVPVTTERPYTGIAHLKHENGNAIGTGFLVKHGGRIFLVTAAHCLWDRIKEAFRAEIHISLGRNGEYHPFGTITKKSVDFEVPREYKERGDSQYDYGIICLDKEKHMLDECCAFDLEPQTDEYIKSQDLYMSGYPGTPEERKDGVPGWPPDTQWEIKLTTVTVNERSLQYQDATTPGNSGSPVYEIKGDRYVAHGVHINGIDKNRESNEAVRIDVDALMKLVKKAYRHKKKGLHCHQIRSDASGSSSSRSSTLDSFTSGSSSSRSSTLGSPISGSPLQDPPLQDSRPQDPPLQDPQHQDPPLQDPQHQDPLLQDPQHQDPPLQDPQPQDPQHQDPQHQDPPLQDPQHQDPPLQDPQPQDPLLQDPSPQQNRKAPKDNHSEPPKLSWFKRLCKTVKSWFCRACETVKRWFR